MPQNYSNKNLQKQSFQNRDLVNATFKDSDLRGTDFSGADLTGVDFTNIKTGITPLITALIFVAALIISLLSGYVAMLTGRTVQTMLASTDKNVRISGIVSVVVLLVFILYTYWKGFLTSLSYLILPASVITILIGVTGYVSGLGTGKGMLFLVLSYFLLSIMFLIGTLSRAVAGTLSSTILFIIVAVSGGMFGKSVGGGIGTVVMAISCALISKRALSGAKGFKRLRKIAFFLTTKFGTSFRNTKLVNANFSQSKIHNTDFSNADSSQVIWGDSKKINCIIQ